MALQTLHGDQRQLSAQQIGGVCKGSLAAFGAPAFLTNTTIANANTNVGLQTAVTDAAASLHADQRYFADRINLGITLGKYSTELSDARINALTTGTELVELTWADSAVKQGAAYPPE